jgi:hypothetical protein
VTRSPIGLKSFWRIEPARPTGVGLVFSLFLNDVVAFGTIKTTRKDVPVYVESVGARTMYGVFVGGV